MQTLSFIITAYQYKEAQVLREIWYMCPYVTLCMLSYMTYLI